MQVVSAQSIRRILFVCMYMCVFAWESKENELKEFTSSVCIYILKLNLE